MKTIREHFEQLDEPYRTQAIENAGGVGTLLHEDRLHVQELSIIDALMGGFLWASTPQGHEYWNELYDYLNEAPH